MENMDEDRADEMLTVFRNKDAEKTKEALK
jgi:hypothetical protein